jgi:dTDP-4-amino-4,6-dideoxygalactose transaminase
MIDYFRKKYEDEFCKIANVKWARSFRLGRHALVILLKALGVSTGDKVGVCGFTCLSVVEAVKVCGAIPIYLDVDENLCIDPNVILRHKNGFLRIVILQHTFGNPGELDKLLSACRKIGAKIIEDCAHSFGCSWQGIQLGQFGEGAIYSSQWGKPYSTGQGGMLTVNSKKLSEDVDELIKKWSLSASIMDSLILESQRFVYSLVSKIRLNSQARRFYCKLKDIGFIKSDFTVDTNYRFYRGYVRLMDEMTSKAGLKQLKKWPKFQQLRRDTAYLINQLCPKFQLSPWPISQQADVTMLRYPFLRPNKTGILKEAQRNVLDIAGWYLSPVHPLKGDNLLKADYKKGSCPKVERVIDELVHLPTDLGPKKPILENMMHVVSQV